jgi:hypothetical protein
MKPTLLRVVDDSSICHRYDLWGNSPETCPPGELDPVADRGWPEQRLAANPPRVWTPKEFHQGRPTYTLDMLLGIALSHNEKTRVCFSEWFGPPVVRHPKTHRLRENPFGTCAWATELCREMCYGHSTRISSEKPRGVYETNVAELRVMPDEAIAPLGDAMVYTTRYYGLDNLRWHGVGDLNPWSDRIVEYIVNTYDDFMLWGFTRTADRLLKLLDATGGVRPNMLFWCSVDITTVQTPGRLERLCEVARECESGLAFMSTCGTRFSSEGQRLVASHQPTRDEIEIEEQQRQLIFEAAADYGVPVHVCFGYHGKNKRTQLDIDRECPATNPRGNGHRYAACQYCGHCWSRRDLGSRKREIRLP